MSARAVDHGVLNLLESAKARLRGRVRFRRLRRPPVVVGGCERSGTTLLLSVLSAHPAIQAVPTESWAFCFNHLVNDHSRHPIRISRLYRCLGDGPSIATARRWAEKTPANVFGFGEIIAHFGGAVRLIHLVRDGRDVVTSRHPARPDGFWMRPRRWVHAVRAGLEYEDDERVLTIRYEDLVTDSAGTVAAICAHIDEPTVPEVESWWEHATVRSSRNLRSGGIKPIFGSSLRKFERPDFPFAARVEDFMQVPGAPELLEHFGYH